MALFTPTNQKRLTNVSVVRLKKAGNRYELACYPNKTRAWRDKLECNLDEVLQARVVFSNVSKGEFANKKEMYLAFRTEDETQIIRTILEQGELQLTEKERQVEKQSLFRDVAKLVSEKCVNPETNRAYTVTMIETMMKDCHISLKANKSSKQHALEVIKQLRSVDGFKIAPAMLEVVISIDISSIDQIKSKLLNLCNELLREGPTNENNYELAVVIEPDRYNTIESLLRNEIKGKFCIEMVGNKKPSHRRINAITPVATAAPTVQALPNATDLAEPSLKHLPPLIDVKQEKVSTETVVADSEQSTSKSQSSTAKKLAKSKRKNKQSKRKARDDWPDDSDD